MNDCVCSASSFTFNLKVEVLLSPADKLSVLGETEPNSAQDSNSSASTEAVTSPVPVFVNVAVTTSSSPTFASESKEAEIAKFWPVVGGVVGPSPAQPITVTNPMKLSSDISL